MIRAVALAGAVAVCAFFALVIRQAQSTNAATARLSLQAQDATAVAARTATLLDHAGTLNPDANVDLLRARYALRQGRTEDAHRILLDVVDREPANLDAWAVIAFAFKDSDPALFQRANAAIARYNPPVPTP